MKSTDILLAVVFLMQQHLSFKCWPAESTETADFAIASDYTVTGNNQGQWIFGKCVTDGPNSGGPV